MQLSFLILEWKTISADMASRPQNKLLFLDNQILSPDIRSHSQLDDSQMYISGQDLSLSPKSVNSVHWTYPLNVYLTCISNLMQQVQSSCLHPPPAPYPWQSSQLSYWHHHPSSCSDSQTSPLYLFPFLSFIFFFFKESPHLIMLACPLFLLLLTSLHYYSDLISDSSPSASL